MFLGKIMIAAGTTGAVYAFIQYSKTYTFLSPLLILLVNYLFILVGICLLIYNRSNFYGCILFRYGYFISLLYSRLDIK